ncbi:MAG: hypothetical protein HRT69_06700 [Flavobacteriaceae bacterium]|nr:hypothetical protein [Flavobacteriaceae bacterium]
MIRSGYKQIFQVKVLHSYFNDNVCSCLDFVPSDSTMKMMQRFGLILRSQIDGFSFYCSTKDSLINYLNYIEKVTNEISFNFNVHSKDIYFNLITDLPTNWLGTISFNSENKTNTFSKKGRELKGVFLKKDYTGSLARLEINFKDIVQLTQQNSVAEFVIKFKSRATQWQYYIINRSSVKLDNPKISSKTDMSFEGPFKTTIATGEEALLFTSGDHLIPLAESPNYKFSLINEAIKDDNSQNKRTSSKVILNGLPNPTPERIGFKVDTITKLVSSPMYVYI